MFILHMWKNKNQGGNTLFYKMDKGNFDKCLRGEENKVTDIFHRLDKLNTEINKYYNFKKEEWDKLNYYERQKIGSLKKYKPEKEKEAVNISIIFKEVVELQIVEKQAEDIIIIVGKDFK